MNEIHFRLAKMVRCSTDAAHGMVCRQVLAAARNTQRVVLCCVQQRVWECAAAGGAPRA